MIFSFLAYLQCVTQLIIFGVSCTFLGRECSDERDAVKTTLGFYRYNHSDYYF